MKYREEELFSAIVNSRMRYEANSQAHIFDLANIVALLSEQFGFPNGLLRSTISKVKDAAHTLGKNILMEENCNLSSLLGGPIRSSFPGLLF